MAKAPFARVAVRDSGDLILGVNIRGLLKPGHVYEAVKSGGDILLRDIGPSAATDGPPGLNWCRDPAFLIEDGRHLSTQEEETFRVSKAEPTR